MNEERLKIFFAPHLPEALTVKFLELFGWSQVFALEDSYSEGVEERESKWNDASQGLDEYEPDWLSPFFLFTEKLAGVVHNSKKTVVLERSPITQQESVDTYSLFSNARTYWKKAEPEGAKRLLKQYLRDFGTECHRRDQSYAVQLKEMLAQLPSQRILAIRGPIHSMPLHVQLEGLDVNFEAIPWVPAYVPSLQEEATIRVRSGKEVKDEELLRIHIEADLTPRKLTYSEMVHTRNRVLALSSREMEGYCNKLAEHPGENDSPAFGVI